MPWSYKNHSSRVYMSSNLSLPLTCILPSTGKQCVGNVVAIVHVLTHSRVRVGVTSLH
jgi:hypothetical protein